MSDGNEQLREDVERIRRVLHAAYSTEPDPADVEDAVVSLNRLAAALSVSGGGDENERLRAALRQIAEKQPDALAMIRDNGFEFSTPLGKPDDERTNEEAWEKLAFTLYTDLCEVDSIARAALAEGEPATETT